MKFNEQSELPIEIKTDSQIESIQRALIGEAGYSVGIGIEEKHGEKKTQRTQGHGQ